MKSTRRHFIKSVAGIAVASPLIIPQRVFAADKKIGVTLISAGLRSEHLSNSFGQDKRVRILYVTDPDINRAKKLCGQIEKNYGYRPEPLVDFRKTLDDKAVDAISCASCNHWHALTAIWALQAGKHCYMEKPLTYNLAESKTVIAVAEKSGLVFQSGTQRRSTTNVNELIDYIHNGGIGEVKLARICGYRPRKAIGALGNYPIPQSVDYDFWSGPAPVKPLTRREFHYDWHWQRLYGNGDLGNQCPHRLDIAHWGLGLKGFPQSVLTYGGRLGYDVEMNDPNYQDAGDVANSSITIYNYGDKSIVCEVRGLPSPAYNLPNGKISTMIGVVFYGTEGYGVQAPHGRGNIYSVSCICDLKGNLVKEFKSTDSKGNMTSSDNSTHRHVANFLDAIQANDPKKVAANVRCGTVSADLAHLGNIAYFISEKNNVSIEECKKNLERVKSSDDNEKTFSRMVKHLETNGVDLKRTPLSMSPALNLNVEKEIFIGNNQANALMTREYRKPFVVPETI
jgi:predicted dehydrogenase